MSVTAIMRRLAEGPATNAQLCEIACEDGGTMAKILVSLRKQGRVERIDGRTGRGTRATYALTEKGRTKL